MRRSSHLLCRPLFSGRQTDRQAETTTARLVRPPPTSAPSWKHIRPKLLPAARCYFAAGGVASAASVSRVSLQDDAVRVEWSDSSAPATFPYVWLRDNCQCPKCFHPTSHERLLLFSDLDVDIKARSVELCTDTGKVVVTWPDGHVSPFDPSWLRERVFDGEATKTKRDKGVKTKSPVFFPGGHGVEAMGAKHDFGDIMQSEQKLLDWLRDLESVGLTLIRGMEGGEAALPALVARVGVLRSTHYGDYFRVESKGDAVNLAYTNTPLGLHADLGYYSYMPGTQFLHCLRRRSVEGGLSEYSDGFGVADFIRRNHPKEWEALTTIPVMIQDEGTEALSGPFYKINEFPTVLLNDKGEPIKITFSQMHRDSHMAIPVEKVKPLYKALDLFYSLAYSPAHLVTYQMEEGDCAVFDNLRVLHGRQGFELTGQQGSEKEEEGHRLLHGCYIDWDEIKSRINALEVFGTKSSSQ